MRNIWTIAELDPHKLFEVVPNRDPETSVRFSLPIPNWLSENLESRFQHSDIKPVVKSGKKELRFIFHNYEDGCDQAAKIDGQGVIIFTSPTPAQANNLRRIIFEHVDNLADLTPDNIKAILSRAYSELGLLDRFNGNRSDIVSKMDPVGNMEKDAAFGSFVYKPVVSSCIYLSGTGEFHGGPTATPQIFEAGGFITFPGQTAISVAKLINSYTPDDPTKKIGVKVVSKAMFLKSRRTLDQRPINMETIPVQDRQLRKIYKPQEMIGFPEWLPEIRDIERQWIATIAEVFERYGFANIETPAVEEIAVLAKKGEDIDKEIFGVGRLQEDPDNSKEPRFALHYDLTVPMSRYVARHYSSLTFPFKRYQIQKVWRGERPQKGRFRERIQCDIDVVDRDSVSLEFDAEFPIIIYDLLQKLNVGNVIIGISNRKILQGFYRGLGLEDPEILQIIHLMGKIGEIGQEGFKATLAEELLLSEEIVNKCIELVGIKESGPIITDRIMALGVDPPLLREGLRELDFVMGRMSHLPKGIVVADLSIVRDFDYYTGTVYEGRFADYPDYPIILAGGRYDDLVGNFMNRALPGVGISLGLTRIFSKLVQENRIPKGKKTPTQALITVSNAAMRNIALNMATSLRDHGIPTEVYYEPIRLDQQIAYAEKKGIPFVIFPDPSSPQKPEVRDMKTGIQQKVEIQAWNLALK